MDSWQNNHLVFFTSPHHAVTILITRVKRRLRKWEVSVSKHFSFIDETTKKKCKNNIKFSRFILLDWIFTFIWIDYKFILRWKNSEINPETDPTKIHELDLVDKWQRKIVFHPNGFVCIFCSQKTAGKMSWKTIYLPVVVVVSCCDLL